MGCSGNHGSAFPFIIWSGTTSTSSRASKHTKSSRRSSTTSPPAMPVAQRMHADRHRASVGPDTRLVMGYRVLSPPARGPCVFVSRFLIPRSHVLLALAADAHSAHSKVCHGRSKIPTLDPAAKPDPNTAILCRRFRSAGCFTIRGLRRPDTGKPVVELPDAYRTRAVPLRGGLGHQGSVHRQALLFGESSPVGGRGRRHARVVRSPANLWSTSRSPSPRTTSHVEVVADMMAVLRGKTRTPAGLRTHNP